MHRNELPSGFYCQDQDGVIVMFTNGEDRSFTEYIADDFKNCGQLIREYAVAAFIERKETTRAFSLGVIAIGPQLHACRVYGKFQDGITPVPTVIIGKELPLTAITMSATTGAILFETEIYSGIERKRKQLTAWLWRDR
jgi:hypothetical protein